MGSAGRRYAAPLFLCFAIILQKNDILLYGIAFLVGKLVTKLKLPSILGWLIAGMALVPHAFSLILRAAKEIRGEYRDY
ncbi:MAG: hypothetical protein HFH80_02540 [Lachnospiraceae bacterium]|nr:hypothetical protein [Lachnospiraceae bacterium]